MKQRKLRISAVALVAVGCMLVGGLSAYFTDGDFAVNKFTTGSISIDLQEPNWDPDDAVNMTPEQEVRKDPQIKNDGINDAFVFMKVTVPYANVIVANDDGTKSPAKADTELYKYDVDTLNWTEVGQPQKDTVAKTVTHLYAYAKNNAMTVLDPNGITSSLFDYIQFVNVIEDEGLEGTEQTVSVEAYGIQTTNLNDGKTKLDGNNADGKMTPAEVWNVLSTQSPSTAVSDAEDPKTDIKL